MSEEKTQPNCQAVFPVKDKRYIQGWVTTKPKPCSRKAKETLTTDEGEELCLCTTHARMAREGFVSREGSVMDANSRKDCRRYDIRPFYKGHFSE